MWFLIRGLVRILTGEFPPLLLFSLLRSSLMPLSHPVPPPPSIQCLGSLTPPHSLLSLKLHKERDDKNNRFLDLYMHLWDQNQPLDVLIMGKKVTSPDDYPRLTNGERVRLGIPQWAWEASEGAQLNLATQGGYAT